MKNGDSANPTVPLMLPTARTVATRLTRALVLQQQILTEALPAAFVVAVSSPGLMAPPPRPRQHRFVRGNGPPDQPVQQPARLGNPQRYQGFIPFLLSPFLPPKHSFARRLTTAK